MKLMGTFKVTKECEEQNTHDGNDRISLFPDCILHHILSFLPTKEAVATCALSKRWKYLWTSVPSIDFDDSLLYSSKSDMWHPLDVESFMSFVEKVLLLRDSSSIKRFRLSCRVCFNASHVNEWILAAVRHNAQELDLCLFVEEPFALPNCVFDNDLLRVLKLEMNCTLHLPPRISFQCLRTLHLCLVTFPNDKMMQNLFSACPFLEELAVLDCEWMNVKSITIRIPSLKVLIIDDLPFCSVDDLHGCEIRIDAGNLVLFEYSGYLSNEINVYDLSSSALALIHIPNLCWTQQKIASRTVKLFGGLKNVSSLRISSGTIESLFLAENLMDRLPVFENLKLLELRGEFGKSSVKQLMKFTQCLPKLEHLHFCEGLGCHSGDALTFKLVLNSTLLNLKTINYQNLNGTEIEIWFLKFLLEVAVALEKMNVFWSKSCSLHPTIQKEITDLLQTCPRGSSHCELTFT